MTAAERAERDERIAELTRAGYTAAQIAVMFGITGRTVARVRGRAGVAKPKTAFYTPEEVDRIEAMLDDGCSYKEIGRTLGHHPIHIAHRFPGRSVWRNRGARMKALMAELEAIPTQINRKTTA